MKTKTSRVGVFSGTFDPFHIGHLEVCLAAIAACDLEIVAVITERIPRSKQDITSYQSRVDMIELATSNYCIIVQLDIMEDAITTSNTLPVLCNRFGQAEYWYILGSDIVYHMVNWPQLNDLLRTFKLCVVLRNNQHRKTTEQALEQIQQSYPHLRYKILPAVCSLVSSSKVRAQLKKFGYSPYLHRDVLRYIHKNHIY